MIVFHSRRFAEHTPPPGHPEGPERADVLAGVAERWRAVGGTVREPRAATREELERVHTPAFVTAMLALAGQAAAIDGDTYTSPESIEVALLAAGAAIDAAGAVLGEPALVLARPPGHHAEAGRAMGFCLFNNAALAARAATAAGKRVAIVDIDVHHGNGTQSVFYEDADVFYASTHQFPYYPGTGAAEERGAGPGEGSTLNVPLAAGAGDDEIEGACADAIVPAIEAFGPDVMIVSAGFDAHFLDPLGGLRVSTAGYRRVMERLADASRRTCQDRSVWVIEGGYHLGALAECLDELVDVLSGGGVRL